MDYQMARNEKYRNPASDPKAEEEFVHIKYVNDEDKECKDKEHCEDKEDISEDGYWGVKQTSQRLFDFASALAGDDVEQMKKMQAAMQKGFKEATGAWGKELPEICQKTLDAANKKFEEYYNSKKDAE